MAASANFFVYYTVSKEYRRLFDQFLGIGRLKKIISKRVSRAHIIQPVAIRSRNAFPRVGDYFTDWREASE
ncbi:hypothetical protein GCK32_011454 [Trichostrongylus colubriformis]|uniref:Uncharacterized protein n=1 Tax=Trichostrongylus colubriformis TaxID=6319 RepID=A0AAN8FUY8_TRICO